MPEPTRSSSEVHTEGQLIHWARGYDRLWSVLTLGREKRFRGRIIEAAGLRAGQRVLDVGCGTGTLALAACAAVGPDGRVEGIDPSPEMIARARDKSAAAGRDARFQVAAIEALPFPDASFDAVLSSMMFHHLGEPLKRAGLAEVRRVLAPGGRLTIVDFAGGGPLLHRLAGRLMHDSGDAHAHPHAHAGSAVEQLEREAMAAGFVRVTSAPFGPKLLFELHAEVAQDG